MNWQIGSYLPMLILSAGAILVFSFGALAPHASRFFRGIAIAASGAACLAALGLVQDTGPSLVDTGGYAQFFTFLLCALTGLSVLFSGEYARRRGFERDEFHALMLLGGLGMVLLAVAVDWIMFAIALEILSLSLYVLIASRRDKDRPVEAAVKYFVLGAVASAMVFMGIALLYAASGEVGIEASLKGAVQGEALLGMAFILAGLGFKLSLAPLHLWTPDVYQGAPAPVAAFLSGGAKVSVFAALLRIAMTGSPAWQAMEPAMWVVVALSVMGGTLGALTQDRVKRMLAYSSVTHVGFMVLALMAVDTAGPAPAMFAAAALGVMDVAVFGCLGLFSPLDDDADRIDVLRGAASRNQPLAAALALSLLTLAGLPPTVGFMSKLVVFKAALTGGYVWLSVIAVVSAIVSVYYVLRVLAALYAKPKGEVEALASPGATGWVAVWLSVLLMIGLGVAPMPVLDAAAWAVNVLP